ncbi:MAG: hypothetical protein IKT31_09680 [Firmicutes bacterium]|nr:hypothetical protein [Bacillota bacterium]
MTEIPNQRSILGIVLLLLLLGGQNKGPGSAGLGSLAGLGNLSALGKNLQLDRFARDMHRVVAMMDQVEGLTQMAGLSQLASGPSSSHIDGAANSVSNALSDTLTSFSGQDLNQLMEMAGPLMEMLGSRNIK